MSQRYLWAFHLFRPQTWGFNPSLPPARLHKARCVATGKELMLPQAARLPEALREAHRGSRAGSGAQQVPPPQSFARRSPSHSHTLSPSHCTMLQPGPGLDGRRRWLLLLQFRGLAAPGGAAQPHAPAQGLNPSSRSRLCPRPLPWARPKSPQGPRVSWDPAVTEAGMSSGSHPGCLSRL